MVPRNDMLRPRHPATADEAFGPARGRFAPKVLGVLLVFVITLLTPGLIRRFVPDVIDRLTRSPTSSATSTTLSPPSVAPLPEPDLWVVEQLFFDSDLALKLRPGINQYARVAQTFHPPSRRLAIRQVVLWVTFVRGTGMRLSLVEIAGDNPPSEGKRRWSTVIPAAEFRGTGFRAFEVVPALPVQANRTYALVVAPADYESHLAVGRSRQGGLVVSGRAWVMRDVWLESGDDLAFRLKFEELSP